MENTGSPSCSPGGGKSSPACSGRQNRGAWPTDGAKYVDSLETYLNHLDPFETAMTMYFRRACPFRNAEGLGMMLCSFPDLEITDPRNQGLQTPVYAGMAFVSEPLWNNPHEKVLGDPLFETIPNFHNTTSRLAALKEAIQSDPLGRVKEVQKEIDWYLSRESDCHLVVDYLKSGELPLRCTHNDTKLNNILFDKTTGEGLCVIDLDTVMPGLAANDFGDSIRFGANHCAEDEADLSKVNFSMELFEIYTKGFLQAAGETFTPLEKQTLPWGAKLMTMECGMRFLADYLEGDHYFHINYETQNLNRARTQFKLTADMERNWDAMQKVIEKYC